MSEELGFSEKTSAFDKLKKQEGSEKKKKVWEFKHHSCTLRDLMLNLNSHMTCSNLDGHMNTIYYSPLSPKLFVFGWHLLQGAEM